MDRQMDGWVDGQKSGVYGIAFIIRNVIEHNREWINKCVLDCSTSPPMLCGED